MSNSELPADVRRLILSSIPSVPYLEAVLLLRAQPQQPWDAAQLARRLYVPERTGAELLQQLRDNGVAVAADDTGRVRYGPEPGLADVLEQLARCYSADLVAVTDLIHSRIDRRAHQFADAFRFRKDKEPGT
jgi:DNA-binding IclR family transcriptional regulator